MASVTDDLKRMIEKAVEKYSNGEDIKWDVGLMMIPPQGEPGYFLTIILPSALLGGAHITGGLIQQGHNVTEDEIDAVISNAIEQGRQQRTAALGKTISATPPPAANQTAPSSGLIL